MYYVVFSECVFIVKINVSPYHRENIKENKLNEQCKDEEESRALE